MAKKATAKKTTTPPERETPATVRGGGFEWHERQGISRDQWLGVVEEGKLPHRIRQLDKTTFCCYRDGKYLGSEGTLEKAFHRIKANVPSDRNIELSLWIKHHPDELPPGLDLTAAERAEYWRHNPPKGGTVRTERGRGQGPRPGEDPATTRLRAALAADGGAGGNGKGRRSSRPSDGSEPLDGAVLRVKAGAAVPKKPGSAAHGRWTVLWAHDGRTVAEYRKANGNMTTLANAMAKKFVTVEER